MEEQNTNYIPPVYPSENPKTDKSKKTIPLFVGIVIIVLVAVILFGGVFAWQYFAVKNIPTAGPVLNAVEGWKTYTSTKYTKHGFEIKYPQDWMVDESGLLRTVVVVAFKNLTPILDKKGDKFYSNINILTRSLSDWKVKNLEEYISLDKSMIQQYVAKEVKFDSDEKVILDGGVEGYISGFSGLENNIMVHDIHLIVINDGDAYVVAGTTLDENWVDYKDKFKEALTSFKFTSPNQTADWKTYTNTQYGFEFKYPENWQLWEMNPVLGLVRIYPNSKSEQAINKTLSTTDGITFSAADRLYGGEAQQINIGNMVWFSAIMPDTPPYCDGCTEKALSYSSAMGNNKYMGVFTGISNKEIFLKILSTFKFTK